MRLTSFTDYSLRVLMYLAADPDRRATIGEIAGAFGISEHHLVKVVHFLGKARLLDNQRGRGGGIAPAIARVKCAFGPWFYVAPVALYASLAVRFVSGFANPGARAVGGVLNVVALAVFAATMARAIQVGFRVFRRPRRPPPGDLRDHPSRHRPS